MLELMVSEVGRPRRHRPDIPRRLLPHTVERLHLTLATEDIRLARAAEHSGTPTTSLAELP
ncbi:hypothetical protein MUO93_05155 [Candidatus Bathyarchaeota archaeon]|nr:hypothetical protein [Candidatus Bathyarchaeota archaeon]